MKNAKIVLVAAWDGWCGSCTAARPLVLTRTGRLGVRSWLTADPVESRPLTLTCRLCGSWTLVPAEQDDPPVELSDDDSTALQTPAAAPQASLPSATAASATALAATAPAGAALSAPTAPPTAPPAALPVRATTLPTPAPPLPLVPHAAERAAATAHPVTGLDLDLDLDLDRARAALGATLRAHLAQRSRNAPVAPQRVPVLVPSPTVSGAPAPMPALPLQRSAPSEVDSLATLELLADGFDLLGTGRP